MSKEIIGFLESVGFVIAAIVGVVTATEVMVDKYDEMDKAMNEDDEEEENE